MLELCHKWEAAAQLPPDSTIRRVTIRSGVVLGKDGGMIKQIYLPFFLGLGGSIGSGSQYMPWIHVTDLIGMFLFALGNKNVQGILNGVAPQVILPPTSIPIPLEFRQPRLISQYSRQIVTNKEFTRVFASTMQRPAFLPIPSLALNILLNKERAKVSTKRIVDLHLLTFGRILLALFQIMLEGQKVVPKRVKELGFEFQYPDINSACAEILGKSIAKFK